ncbi:hypothetical protein NPIL_419251 [Nephila pilipes]|uniref:Uncharacterized protein n=1 Tax=Nephila pilipes TaxID=299642 RepID=A0A8X6PZ05_NEPPI|nr:hypothetical protein NPIL_419251 [Nephila pilipes]
MISSWFKVHINGLKRESTPKFHQTSLRQENSKEVKLDSGKQFERHLVKTLSEPISLKRTNTFVYCSDSLPMCSGSLACHEILEIF